MATNNAQRSPQDVLRVNVNDDDDLQYWTDRFEVSADCLRTAVDKVGVRVDAVVAELKKNSRA